MVAEPRLLAFVSLDLLLDLPLDRVEVERRRRLHRGIFDRSLRELRHFVLYVHETPKLAGVEGVYVPAA